MSASGVGSTLAFTEQLEALLFQFITLYERLAEERELNAKQAGNMALLIKKLSEQVQQFSRTAYTERQELMQTVRASLDKEGKEINELIKLAATKQLTAASKQLESACQNVLQTLTGYEKNQGYSKWMMFAGGIIGGIVTGVLIVTLFMPSPILPLTQQQLMDLQSGELVKTVWPKLSAIDRQHFRTIGDKVIQRHPEQYSLFLK